MSRMYEGVPMRGTSVFDVMEMQGRLEELRNALQADFDQVRTKTSCEKTLEPIKIDPSYFKLDGEGQDNGRGVSSPQGGFSDDSDELPWDEMIPESDDCPEILGEAPEPPPLEQKQPENFYTKFKKRWYK
jgi:hypothetical protein